MATQKLTMDTYQLEGQQRLPQDMVFKNFTELMHGQFMINMKKLLYMTLKQMVQAVLMVLF